MRVGLTLRTMMYFGLRSLRRTEQDAAALGVDRNAYLDTFERKLCATITRAGVEDVLAPASVRAIVARFRDVRGDIVSPEAIAELAGLEDGSHARA